jgi:hypothetical protein
MKSIVVTNVGKESVTDYEAFKYYRENAKYRDVNLTNHIKVHTKVISSFYKKIGDALIENEGGVYIKGLGYFSVVMYPKKHIVKTPYQTDGFANFKTGNYLYLPTFFGQSGKNPLLNFWIMDRTFSRRLIKARLHKALISGKKYKTYVSTLLSLYSYKKKDK